MELVHARGVDFHSVILLRGETWNLTMSLPTLVELRDIGPKISSILQRYDYGRSSFSAKILRNFHSYLWDTSLKILEQRTQVIPCLAGQTQLVVNGDGNVSSCEMLPPVGNIRDHRLPDIIQSDAYQAQVKMIKNKGCHCTHNCAMLDSIFFNPKNLPNCCSAVPVDHATTGHCIIVPFYQRLEPLRRCLDALISRKTS